MLKKQAKTQAFRGSRWATWGLWGLRNIRKVIEEIWCWIGLDWGCTVSLLCVCRSCFGEVFSGRYLGKFTIHDMVFFFPYGFLGIYIYLRVNTVALTLYLLVFHCPMGIKICIRERSLTLG